MNQVVQNTLTTLHRGQLVTVIYDGKFENKRLQVTGKVVRVDQFWSILQINNIGIDFSEILEILT